MPFQNKEDVKTLLPLSIDFAPSKTFLGTLPKSGLLEKLHGNCYGLDSAY